MRRFRLCRCVGTEKENNPRGGRERTSCKSYFNLLCNATYPIFSGFLSFPFFCVNFSQWILEIPFWAKLHQINRVHVFIRIPWWSPPGLLPERSCFPLVTVVVRTFGSWSSCFLCSVYRAVNTTDSDGGSCCRRRAVVRSSRGVGPVDWRPPHVQRSHAVTAGT